MALNVVALLFVLDVDDQFYKFLPDAVREDAETHGHIEIPKDKAEAVASARYVHYFACVIIIPAVVFALPATHFQQDATHGFQPLALLQRTRNILMLLLIIFIYPVVEVYVTDGWNAPFCRAFASGIFGWCGWMFCGIIVMILNHGWKFHRAFG
jgi:hypothetical protein